MKIGLLRNLLKTAGLLSMFEDRADCRRQTKGQRSTDESDLQLEIDSSLSEAILAEDWLKPEEEAAWQDL